MSDTMLTIPQAAELMGVRPGTLKGWVLTRQIAYIRVGQKLIRIPKSEVDKFLERGRVEVRRA